MLRTRGLECREMLWLSGHSFIVCAELLKEDPLFTQQGLLLFTAKEGEGGEEEEWRPISVTPLSI